MKTKGILIADAHIKQRLWTNYPRIQGDSYEALKKVQEAADGGFVMSCGDLFDSNRPSSTDLKAVSDLLRNIETFYYINGNHDSVVPDIVSSLGTNTVHLDDTGTDIGGVLFYGIDWCNSKEELVRRLENINQVSRQSPRKKILILHQSLDVFFMQYIITLQEIWEMMEASFDIFIGDIHIHKTVTTRNVSCTSPGPLVPQDIQQCRNAQYMIALDCTGGDLITKDIPLKVRDYYFLESPENLDNTVKEALEHKRYPLIPVIFVKALHGYKVPKEFVNRDDIIVVANTLPAETHNTVQEAQTAGTLLDAVLEEIAETEPDKAQIMKPLAERLYSEELPDEYLLGLLNKWEIIRA